MPDSKTIAVIGGSIAGLEFARRLKELDREDRYELTVYEEHDKVGDGVRCAEGWVYSPESGRPPGECVEMEAHEGVLSYLDDSYKVVHQLRTPLSGRAWVISRRAYQSYLAELCHDRGARIKTGLRQTIHHLPSSVSLIVDASGCPSQFQREFEKGPRSASVGFQHDVLGDFSGLCGRMITDLTAHAFGFWIFPKGEKRANVGIWWQEGVLVGHPRERLREYMEAHAPSGSRVFRSCGGFIGSELQHPLYHRQAKTVLVGDAAGLAEPFSGEGISSAIISARILADCVTTGSLELYELRVLAALGPKLEAGRLTRSLWRTAPYGTLISAMSSLQGMAAVDRIPHLEERLRHLTSSASGARRREASQAPPSFP
ncbi:MAG TPA: NAD(P)/FAD-dependent oxidoreductase [Dehalococcoidia bacterium]|nr:NAD(P)/FAD-dependent oxidoreductase [Dehalococcoidia bacterium]